MYFAMLRLKRDSRQIPRITGPDKKLSSLPPPPSLWAVCFNDTDGGTAINYDAVDSIIVWYTVIDSVPNEKIKLDLKRRPLYEF